MTCPYFRTTLNERLQPLTLTRGRWGGSDLVGQRVLLRTHAVRAGLLGACGVLADRVVQVLGHFFSLAPRKKPRLHTCAGEGGASVLSKNSGSAEPVSWATMASDGKRWTSRRTPVVREPSGSLPRIFAEPCFGFKNPHACSRILLQIWTQSSSGRCIVQAAYADAFLVRTRRGTSDGRSHTFREGR